MVITIDGPTASGKSSVARGLANKLGFYCLSSGLLYRALSYILLKKFNYQPDQLFNPSPADVEQALSPERFVYSYDQNRCGTIHFDGEDITPFLKKTDIAHCASVIGTNEFVREKLKDMQHIIAQKYDLIVEGRDSGSVIFPNAAVKFYLTAPVEVRAERLRSDIKRHKNNDLSIEQAIKTTLERDKRDSERKIAPLVIPNGAIVFDNATLNLEQTVSGMLKHIP